MGRFQAIGGKPSGRRRVPAGSAGPTSATVSSSASGTVSTGNEATRFKTPGDASKELYESFNVWTGKLSTYAPQVAFALIAANWAVHGTRTEILSNIWARLSLTIAVVYLAALLPQMAFMILLLKRQHGYANDDRLRWAKEADADAQLPANQNSPWPYTSGTEILSKVMRTCHVWLPFLSGALLAISLFFGNPAVKPKGDEPQKFGVLPMGSGLERIGEVNGFLAGDAAHVRDGDAALSAAVQAAALVWARNRQKGKDGVLLIVGSTDRLRLKSAERERFDANVGLAQARGEEIRKKLLETLNSQAPKLAPRSDQVLVLTAGPSHVPPVRKCASCSDGNGYPEDRRVVIWALWGVPGNVSGVAASPT